MTSTTGRISSLRVTGGFTLLELIAVLVLISTVLAIAAPSLRGFVRARQTADVAARMLSLTHLARSRAVSWGAVHRLNIDDEDGVYWLTAQEIGAFVEIEGGQGRKHTLPRGVSVAVALDATSELPTAEEDEPPYIQFYPDGRCDPATIEVTGNEGDVLHVTCTTPSERFRVVTPREEERR